MSFDFFAFRCREPSLDDTCFGICDDENGEKAYIDRTNRDKWIATVKNPRKVTVTFTAIDKCVLQDSDYKGRGRCDGMLTSQDHLYLIELKNKRESWAQDAIRQLTSTIEFLQEFHPDKLKTFRYKKAFACNKKRKFEFIEHEKKIKFYRKYNFRLDRNSEVKMS
jgi:hypothetical protein